MRSGIDGRPASRVRQGHRFLVRIAAQQRQVVLASAEVLDRQVRVVCDGIPPGTSSGVRLFAFLPVGRHSGRSVGGRASGCGLIFAAFLRLRVRVELFLGAESRRGPIRSGHVVQRRHRLAAVHDKVAVALSRFVASGRRLTPVPASRRRSSARCGCQRRNVRRFIHSATQNHIENTTTLICDG